MKSSAAYVYCVIDRAESEKLGTKLARPPDGLPGAEKPRLVDVGGFAFAVTANVPLPEYSGEEIEKRLRDLDWVSRCAVAHEAVVAHYAKQVAVVPMKMFTLFTSDARAAEDLGGKKKSILKVFDRVRGREEWGVRLAFDEARAIATASAADRAERRDAEKPSGKQFLQRKKGERDVREKFRANAARDASALFDELAVSSDDARKRPMPAVAGTGARVVLDAAFLIYRDKAEKFFVRVDAERERLSPQGYDLVLTGPWPPYNFVEEGGRST